MLRLLVIAAVSVVALFPLLNITTEVFGLSDNTGGIVSAILAFVVVPYLLLAAWPAQPNPEVIPVDMDDPIMREQMHRARSEIARFISGLKEARQEAFIKFPYRFGDETEHVWGVAHAYDDGYFTVSLASQPVGEVGEAAMARLRIAEQDLEDWTLTDARGRISGGYTMLAMARIYERDFGRLPKSYARDLRDFVDFNWPDSKGS